MSQGQTQDDTLDSKRGLFNLSKGKAAGMGDSGENILGGTLAGNFLKAQADLNSASNVTYGAIGTGDRAEAIKAAPSIFNPFNVFRFHRFGPTIGGEYKIGQHKDVNAFGGESGGKEAEKVKKFGANLLQYYAGIGAVEDSFEVFDSSNIQKAIQNPTAQQILEWVKRQSEAPEGESLAPAPYQINDFLWCKYYGKVPNNRMVTLRRYPWPVEDNMKLLNSSDVPVPLAQAVTWFGEEIDNKLDNVLSIQWDMNWGPLEAKVKDILGNEILVDDVLEGIGVEDETTKNAIRIAIATGQGENLNTLELAGYDEKMYKWMSEAYSDNGPYWNRVLGPVNVVNKTIMRDRGMGEKMFKKDIILVFEYSLRSYQGINPKIAFLDLLTNFLTLTYNTAPFWGGGYRYFPKPGLKIASSGSDLIEQGHVIDGIQATLNEWISKARGSTATLLEGLADQFDRLVAGGVKGDVDNNLEVDAGRDTDAGTKVLDNLMAGRASALMRAPLSFRSLLEGRPIGEWHMVVGNPMNPIATIGNLYVKSVDMDLSEALGADDFPVELKFTVHLGHGKPRAKQDVESMFNLGNGALSFSQLSPPSSASNTFGGVNHEPDLKDSKISGEGGNVNPTYTANNINIGKNWPAEGGADAETRAQTFEAGLLQYKKRVTAAYGSAYGNSNVLGDYIIKTKT